MKLEYLIIIFILIMVPIMLVFTSYIDNQITAKETEMEYDSKLLSSTYDAIKAYQLNTINNATSDRPVSKVDEVEAAVTTFYNSLLLNFKYDGYGSSVMEEYVPAVVFCLYDGYYIYSPITNTLTGVNDEVDSDYADQTVLNGLKPYVYYNCRYVGSDYDVIITYTLDNYITVDGTIGSDYVYESGYLVDGISEEWESGSFVGYGYDGVTFKATDTEQLKEYLGNKEYYYTKIDGTKFYYHGTATSINDTSDDDYIFYIDSDGDEKVQCKNNKDDEEEKTLFGLYFKAIMANKDAYVYYRDAYKFTNWVRNNLCTLGKFNYCTLGDEYNGKKFSDIFGTVETGRNWNRLTLNYGQKINDACLQYASSAFNAHRAEVIQYVIETNLKTAISAYSNYGSSDIEYIMPKISDTDWELITNNVCIATFMQGMSIGSKVYNSYSVVANTLTKEYVDEEDIYIITESNTYCKVNDTSLLSDGIVKAKSTLGYYAGALKLDFERRKYNNIYYYPKSYEIVSSSGETSRATYLGSYTSIIGSTSVASVTDMYQYVVMLVDSAPGVQDLKEAYYRALGRERTQVYRVQNGTTNDGGPLSGSGTVTVNGGGYTVENNYYYLRNYGD